MATALGAGILLDATIVRALLVPALVDLARTMELVASGLGRTPPASEAIAGSCRALATRRQPMKPVHDYAVSD